MTQEEHDKNMAEAFYAGIQTRETAKRPLTPGEEALMFTLWLMKRKAKEEEAPKP